MNLNQHVSEEKLEAYHLGKLSTEEIDLIDDHVYICERCQLRMEETDVFVKAIRTAAGRIREETFFENRPRPWWQRALQPIMAKPTWAVAGVALLGAAFLLPVTRPGPITYQEVALRATRGTEAGSSFQASSGKNTRVRLRLDTSGVATAGIYRVAVVDSEGHAVWETTASRPTSSVEELLVTVERPIDPGSYWVRLFDQSGNKLLREFQLGIS